MRCGAVGKSTSDPADGVRRAPTVSQTDSGRVLCVCLQEEASAGAQEARVAEGGGGDDSDDDAFDKDSFYRGDQKRKAQGVPGGRGKAASGVGAVTGAAAAGLLKNARMKI